VHTQRYTLNPFLDPAEALTLAEWYVRVAGSDPVGPVSAKQIAQAIREGKVPDDACIARSGVDYWQEVLDSEAVISALKDV
jgi:hypothetical protein